MGENHVLFHKHNTGLFLDLIDIFFLHEQFYLWNNPLKIKKRNKKQPLSKETLKNGTNSLFMIENDDIINSISCFEPLNQAQSRWLWVFSFLQPYWKQHNQRDLVWHEAVFSSRLRRCQTSNKACPCPPHLLSNLSWQNFGLDYHTFQHMVGDCPPDFLQLAFNCCNVSPSSCHPSWAKAEMMTSSICSGGN